MAKLLLGCFRTGDANDPEVYTAALIAVMSDYPLHVLQTVVDPRKGLPSKCKWLPTIAEIKEACEEQQVLIERRKQAEAWQRRVAAPRIEPPPKAPGTSYAEMVAKYGKPIGRFERVGTTAMPFVGSNEHQ